MLKPAPPRSHLLFLALAFFVLGTSAWEYHIAHQSVPEFPIADYCGVGVCPTNIPNRLLKTSLQSTAAAERALLENTASAYPWADLAEVLLAAGDTTKAFASFQVAAQLAPNNPSIRTRAARFWTYTSLQQPK